MNIAIAHREFLRFRLVLVHCLKARQWENNRKRTGELCDFQSLKQQLTKVNGKSAPLRRAGVEMAILYVQVTSADSLGAKAIEESHFGARSDAH